jgi:hypothetical protein
MAWTSQKAEFMDSAKRLRAGDDPMVGDLRRFELEERLAQSDLTRGERMFVRSELARFLLRSGEIDRAVELLEELLSTARGGRFEAGVLRQLGIAHLRQAETENCVARHNAECCIFPLEGGALHELREPALAARAALQAHLELAGEDLELRWLLNLLAMALGDFPEALAEEQRFPEGSLGVSADPAQRFRDVAGVLGVDTFNLCGGAVIEDFDLDGDLDLLTSTLDLVGPLSYHASDGQGGFVDASAASHADDQFGGLNLISGDYDGDGDADVLVLRGGWLHQAGRLRNSLLRNDGGVFVDVTRAAGLAQVAWPTQAASFGDFDNDGLLDILIGNESEGERGADWLHPPQLFHNNGDGSFVDIAEAAGLQGDFYTKGVSVGDFDNDGWLDLYLSNTGPNQLFRNDGAGSFSNVSQAAGVSEPSGSSFATWFFDVNNDGWLDLFVAAYDTRLEDLAREALGLELETAAPALYLNQRDGSFENISVRAGLARPFKPMGANFGDLDGDGFLDIYLATGEPQVQSLMPNVYLHNLGGERFEDLTSQKGLGHLQKGHGVALADFDQDGDLDIYSQLGGFYRVDRFRNALFENPGHASRRWISLDLVGTQSHISGHGARIRVVVSGLEGRREIHRAQGSRSSFGGTPKRLLIGLGECERIERLEVRWPRSEELQSFAELPLDAYLRVTEGEREFERLPYPSMAFKK